MTEIIHAMRCSSDPPGSLCQRNGWHLRLADYTSEVTCKQCLKRMANQTVSEEVRASYG